MLDISWLWCLLDTVSPRHNYWFRWINLFNRFFLSLKLLNCMCAFVMLTMMLLAWPGHITITSRIDRMSAHLCEIDQCVVFFLVNIDLKSNIIISLKLCCITFVKIIVSIWDTVYKSHYHRMFIYSNLKITNCYIATEYMHPLCNLEWFINLWFFVKKLSCGRISADRAHRFDHANHNQLKINNQCLKDNNKLFE